MVHELLPNSIRTDGAGLNMRAVKLLSASQETRHTVSTGSRIALEMPNKDTDGTVWGCETMLTLQ